MKRKLLTLFMMGCTLVASSCQLPFGMGGSSEMESSSGVMSSETVTASSIVEQVTEDMVAIRVSKTDGEETLSEVMEYLQANGSLSYTESGGMITAINGKQNAADWSYCWMVYTSDAEMANTAWGTVEYGGESLGSAVLGMDALPVTEGAVYVWNYTGF